MTIEHKNIQEAGLHEPKGVSVATDGQVYIANGVGGGSWTSLIDVPVGRLDLVDQTLVIALTAGGLHTPASYVDITSNFNEAFGIGGVIFDGTSHFVVPIDGTYRVTTWVSMSSDSAGSPVIGLDININGVAAGVGSAVVQTKQKNANDVVTVSGFGIGSFSQGDVIGLSFASDGNTNITIYDSVFDLQRIRS